MVFEPEHVLASIYFDVASVLVEHLFGMDF